MTDHMQPSGSTCNNYREIIERQLARKSNLSARDRRDVYLGHSVEFWKKRTVEEAVSVQLCFNT